VTTDPVPGDPPGDPPDEPTRPLPEPVRLRVVALTADALPTLGGDELPASLRPVARFTANRRARLGGAAIAAALAGDPLFRQRAAAAVVKASGPLGTAVAGGTPPAAADPVEVAALAYLTRPAGWEALVAAAGEAAASDAGRAAVEEAAGRAERLSKQLDRVRAQAKADAERLRGEVTAARGEADRLRTRARELSKALREAQAAAGHAVEELATERERMSAESSVRDAENRRLRARAADAEAAVEAARRASREGRAVDNARLWLLLDTIVQATQGLRRELALEPTEGPSPADLVAAGMTRDGAGDAGQGGPVRALAADDPARLDQLLALPRAHLVVDGYNVTKTGFGDLPLEQQRHRLVTGLGGLAAQTGSEVTVVFDGAERLPAAPPAPRGVRVLFSRPRETADEVIRRLVRAEPRGRPVVVVSSDREVADGVRRSGAHPLAALALIRRLART
jgi:predicted RNA-binding protein with PIN domain